MRSLYSVIRYGTHYDKRHRLIVTRAWPHPPGDGVSRQYTDGSISILSQSEYNQAMPRSRKADPEILGAALIGLQYRLGEIDQMIADLRARVGSKSITRGVTASSASAEPARRKRNLSPAARKRIAEAQKKRWAAFNAERETKLEKPAPQKQSPAKAAAPKKAVAAKKKAVARRAARPVAAKTKTAPVKAPAVKNSPVKKAPARKVAVKQKAAVKRAPAKKAEIKAPAVNPPQPPSTPAPATEQPPATE